jgi:hypothetical protein
LVEISYMHTRAYGSSKILHSMYIQHVREYYAQCHRLADNYLDYFDYSSQLEN